MTKICTTIEQSKKLIELGINIKSADMCINSTNPYALFTEVKPLEGFDDAHDPTWSLSALLELIPPYLGDYEDGIDFGFGRATNGRWYSAYYLQIFPNGDMKSVKTVIGESAVDAAFKMIVWLKENGKI